MTKEPTIAPEPLNGSIETERLILRRFREEDFDALFEINRNPDTFRYSERGPMRSEEAWSRLLRNIGHWDVKGYGLFAVEEKRTGRLVGEAGLADFHRNLGPSFDGDPEASWTIAPAAQRQGYATEAIRAALAWAQETILLSRSVCLIHVQNEPSLQVANKVGFQFFDRCDYKGYPALLLERGI